MDRINICIIMLLIFTLFLPMSQGLEDNLAFTIGTPLGDKETDMFFIGQSGDSINLEITFGNNCSSYSIIIEGSHPFENPDDGIMQQYMEAGTILGRGYYIDPNAQQGEYNITFIFNYTNDNGDNISSIFYLKLELIKAYIIKNVVLPKNINDDIIIEIETFLHFSNLTIHFNSEGDVGIVNEIVSLYNIDPGTYNLQTSIYECNLSLPGEKQEIYYMVIGYSDNREIESILFSHSVDINWDDNNQDNDINSKNKSDYFQILFLLMMIIIIISLILKRYYINRKN